LKSAVDGWGYLPWNTNEGETCDYLVPNTKKSHGWRKRFCVLWRENDKSPSITHIYFALELFCELIFKNSRRPLSRMGILYSQQFLFGSLHVKFCANVTFNIIKPCIYCTSRQISMCLQYKLQKKYIFQKSQVNLRHCNRITTPEIIRKMVVYLYKNCI